MEEKTEKVFNAREIILGLVFKHKGNWEKIYLDVKNRTRVTEAEVENAKAFIESRNFKVITIVDAEYPEAFKSKPKPPFALMLDGDEKLLEVLNSEGSIGALGKVSLEDKVISSSKLTVLMGQSIVELKTADSFLFVSTSMNDEMTNNETARLFVQLSSKIFLDTTKDRKTFVFAAHYASLMGVEIMSTHNDWILDVAGNVTTIISSFK